MPKKIVIILGHPDSASYCGHLAATYAEAAGASGHSVRFFKLGDVTFDPILRRGYGQSQELESGLKEIQEAITWAEHMVFVFPVWWGSMPALLKGFIDRVFLPGYAFKYRANSPLTDRLLTGRSAQAIVTMDAPLWYDRWVYRSPWRYQLKRCILGFCGIKPVEFISFGTLRRAGDAQRRKWIGQIKDLAKAA